MKQKIKEVVNKHPKKTVALTSIIGTLMLVANFWGDMYRVVCPFMPETRQPACYKSGRAAEVNRATPDGGQSLDAFLLDGPPNE